MTISLTLRKVRLDHYEQKDHEEIIELLSAYHEDVMGANNPWPFGQGNNVISGLREHPTSAVFLALTEEGKAVGIAVCFRGFSTFSAKPIVNIHDLYVLPDFRRKGVAKALFDRIEQHAHELRAGRITLEVRNDNEAAQALYASLGYGAGDTPMSFWGKTL